MLGVWMLAFVKEMAASRSIWFVLPAPPRPPAPKTTLVKGIQSRDHWGAPNSMKRDHAVFRSMDETYQHSRQPSLA
jgi:hypothetical protein